MVDMEQQKNIFLSSGISLIFPVLATAYLGHIGVLRTCWSSNDQLQLNHQLKIFAGFYVVIAVMGCRLFLPYLKMTPVIIKKGT